MSPDASPKKKLGELTSEVISTIKNPSKSGSRKRFPILISTILAFLIGIAFDGAVGLVLAVIVGLLAQRYFGQLKIPLKPPMAFVSFILAPVSKLLIILGLLLPFGNGLTLATGHYPDTLLKYLSIAIVKPENLLATSGENWWFGLPDYYPGAPLIVSISIVLMFIGAIRINKAKYLKFFLAGIVLYTLSPTISYLISTGKFAAMFYSGFYAIGFFITWIGLLLFIGSKYVGKREAPLNLGAIRAPKIKIPIPRRGVATILSSVGMALSMMAVSQLVSSFSGAPLLLAQDEFFEVFHHGIASAASGIVAGIAAYGFMEDADWAGEGNGELMVEDVQQESLASEVTPSAGVGTEVASPDPNDPPGTMIQRNPDGTIVKSYPDGKKGTLYSDNTVHIELPDGTQYTEYPDGTSKTYLPNGTLEIEYPDGKVETRVPDGRVGITCPDGTKTTHLPEGGSVTVKPDGTVTKTEANGSSETWDKDGNTISKSFGEGRFEGMTFTKNKDGTITVESKYGGKATCSEDMETMDGTVTTKDGMIISGKADGSYIIKNDDGTFSFNEEGIDVEFKDGSRAHVDSDGNIDIEIPAKGKATLSNDGNLSMHDNDGNSLEIKNDGSFNYSDKDGTTINGKSDGTYTETTPEGITVQLGKDGSATIANPDGSSASIGNDGSLTVRGADGSTKNYPPEYVKTMAGKQGGGS